MQAHGVHDTTETNMANGTHHNRLPSPSGAQLRNARVARGQPKYTAKEQANRRMRDKQRSICRYERNHQLIDTIKVTRGCADCGYRDHPAALHFDHLPGFIKKAGLARLAINPSITNIMTEIAKCEVVCANCHAVRTSKRREAKRVQHIPLSSPHTS